MALEVLLVKTSSIGDVVHTLPVAETIKRTYPSVRLAWVVERAARDILEGNPYVDELIDVDFKNWKKHVLQSAHLRWFRRFLRILRSRKWDIAIDLQGLIRSGMIAYVSKAPVRIGIEKRAVKEQLNCLFTNRKGPPSLRNTHVVDQHLMMLSLLGITDVRRSFYIDIPRSAAEEAEAFLRASSSTRSALRIALNPAAGWPTKRWPLERYAALGERIVQEFDGHVFILWGPGERETADRLKLRMKEQATCIPPLTLKGLAGLIKRCHVVISGDTGPLHIASALGVPVVGIYGPSDPIRNGPFQGRYRVVSFEGPCRGCYKRMCATAECMRGISVERVWEALVGLLKEAYPHASVCLTDNMPVGW